jgi:hypothetical protein
VPVPPKIPVKTAAGHEEIRHRHRVLGQRHRTVLFLVNGRRTEAEVMALARAAGAPDDCLRDLADLGLILIPEPATALEPVAGPVATADPARRAESARAPSAQGDGRTDAARAAARLDGPSDIPPGQAVAEDTGRDDSSLDDPADAALMPPLTLAPDSSVSGWSRPPATSTDSFSAFGALGDVDDPALERARDTVLRALRHEAPLAGSLTAMRVRRARTRAQLLALLGEVQSHLRKPHRRLASDQTLQQVRALLQGTGPRS